MSTGINRVILAPPVAMPKPLPLTGATRRVHEAILDHWHVHGVSPSLEEIAEKIGRAKQGVHRQVNRLELLGFLRRATPTRGLIPLLDAEGASLGDEVRLPHRLADSSDDARVVYIAEHLCVDPATGETIQLTRSIPDLGFEAGEILVIDTHAEPQAGDAVAWMDEGSVRVGRFGPKTPDVIGVVRSVIRRVH